MGPSSNGKAAARLAAYDEFDSLRTYQFIVHLRTDTCPVSVEGWLGENPICTANINSAETKHGAGS